MSQPPITGLYIAPISGHFGFLSAKNREGPDQIGTVGRPVKCMCSSRYCMGFHMGVYYGCFKSSIYPSPLFADLTFSQLLCWPS